jgi:hypothetical protein
MNLKWMIIGFLLPAIACRSNHRPAKPVVHLAQASQPGALLYLDRLDNRAVLQMADTSGATTFCSFLVGWKDSLLTTTPQKRQDREKYIQYGMQKDWTVVMGGDSLRPVFLQEKPGPDPQVKEAALVFEVPRGHRVDTLVFRDSFSAWGTQIFVLNGK